VMCSLSIVTEVLLRFLEGSHGNDSVYLACLDFLATICAEEGKMAANRGQEDSQLTLTTLLNTPLHEGEILLLSSAASLLLYDLVMRVL